MNRIRDLRKDADLRQIDVSRATGIDQKTLSNYETGKTNPDSFAIIKLADFFNVSADYILGRSYRSIPNKNTLLKQIDRLQSELEILKKIINSI